MNIVVLRLSAVVLCALAFLAALDLTSHDLSSGAAAPTRATAVAGRPSYVPPVRHVFVINLENENYEDTWRWDHGKAPYLARTLRSKGALLNYYYGTAHNSLPNYLAQISGQGPNEQTQGDCQTFSDFVSTGTEEPGQVRGSGCVYPASVSTLPRQLTSRRLVWRGYLQGIGRTCQHPQLGAVDDTQKASATHAYATRHNPFVYFHAIIDDPAYCARHVTNLTRLTHDLRHVGWTPNLVYITPDLCNDGHDSPCADGRVGGLPTVDHWMKHWVPLILASKAFRQDGMLVITSDESEGPQSSEACCGEDASTNAPKPGITGPGGGRVGALVISRWTEPGTWSTTPYNHYSLLASIRQDFGLPPLGYAATTTATFGHDVFTK